MKQDSGTKVRWASGKFCQIDQKCVINPENMAGLIGSKCEMIATNIYIVKAYLWVSPLRCNYLPHFLLSISVSESLNCNPLPIALAGHLQSDR